MTKLVITATVEIYIEEENLDDAIRNSKNLIKNRIDSLSESVYDWRKQGLVTINLRKREWVK
jgi:hypothetical protein